MNECSKLKNQNYGNHKGNEGNARGDPNVVADNANAEGEIFLPCIVRPKSRPSWTIFPKRFALKKSEEKRLVDEPVVRDYPEVFPKDFTGFPPTRQAEFQIDWVPVAAPVARLPYRLSPSKRQEQHAIDSQGLVGYYRRFIEGFSKIAKPLTKLTQKNVKFEWEDKEESTFQLLKQKLYSAPMRNVNAEGESSSLCFSLTQGSREELYDLQLRAGSGSVRSKDLEALLVRHEILNAQAKAMKEKNVKEEKSSWYEQGIPQWKWEKITMDFITKLPNTSRGYDIICVLVDRLTKSAYFLPTKETDTMERLTRLYFKEVFSRHEVAVSIISDQDSRFTSRFW
ncbi:reverse transcriptase domain-containing protein [Tanacetum coccineum]